MLDSLVLVTLRLKGSRSSAQNKAKTEDVTQAEGAEVDAGAWIDRLFAPEDRTPLAQFRARVNKAFHSKSLRWTLNGSRLVPNAAVPALVQEFRQARGDLQTMIQNMVSDWQNVLSRAQRTRGSLYRSEQYPDPGEFRQAYKLDWTLSPVPNDDHIRSLGSISPETETALRESIAEERTEAETAARADLYQRLAAPLKALAEKMVDVNSKGGKGARIHDSILENLLKAAEEVKALAAAVSDPELDKALDQIRSAFGRIPAEDLRGTGGFATAIRRETEQKATQILSGLFGTEAPTAPEQTTQAEPQKPAAPKQTIIAGLFE